MRVPHDSMGMNPRISTRDAARVEIRPTSHA